MDREAAIEWMREWLGDDPDRIEKYDAFVQGVDVGIEVEQSDRSKDMDEMEWSEWLREMFESRVEDSDFTP